MQSESGAPKLGVAIDDRLDFCRDLVGGGVEPTAAQRQQAASLKEVVFDGLVQAIESGVPKSSVTVWADADLGEGVHLRARAMSLGSGVVMSRLVSEPAVLGEAYDAIKSAAHLGAGAALAATAYDPGDSSEARDSQRDRLRLVSERCGESGLQFAVELLPLPALANGSTEMSAMHLVEGIRQLQDAGVNADVWVVEPPLDAKAAAVIAAQAHVDDRFNVSVLFGVGGKRDRVHERPCGCRTCSMFGVSAKRDRVRASSGPVKDERKAVKLAAETPGVDGIMVGGCAFFGQLARLNQSLTDRESAVDGITGYLSEVWREFAQSGETSEVT